MKTLLFIGSLFLMLSFGLMKVNGQTKMTEGRIVYSYSMIGKPPPYAVDTSLCKEKVFRFNANKQRLDCISYNNDTTTEIYNDTTGEIIELANNNGQKTATLYLYQPLALLKTQGRKTKFTNFADTVIIQGYKCYSAYRQVEGDGAIYFVDYTKEIIAPVIYYDCDLFSSLDGFPMGYSFEAMHMRIWITIKSISKEKIDEGIFDIPKDYQIIFRKNMGK